MKKIFISAIVVVSVIVSLSLSPTYAKNQKEIALNSIDFPGDQFIPRKNVSEGMKGLIEGNWVINKSDAGSTTLNIQFLTETKAKITFTDSNHLRGAFFETETNFWEEVDGKLYMTRFKWNDANAGVGHILVNPYSLELVLTETENGGGTSNRIYNGNYEFVRPSYPQLNSALFHNQNKKMNKYGFVPSANSYFYYKSMDGLTRVVKHFNTTKKVTNSPDFALSEYTYAINKNGYFEKSNTEKGKVTHNVLSFPVKKNKTWEAYNKYWIETRKYVKTNYELYPGLKGVIVVKVTNENNSIYEYYLPEYGLIGWGEKMDQPTFLLDEIK